MSFVPTSPVRVHRVAADFQTMALSTPLPTIRPATLDDLDRVIELLWAVAADGRWIGTEVPFDRDVRRAGLAALVSGRNGTLIVADAARDRGPDVVGHITVGVSSYGVADIAMLLAEEWRGRGLGTALLEAGLHWAAAAGSRTRRRSRCGRTTRRRWPSTKRRGSLRRAARCATTGAEVARYGTPFSWVGHFDHTHGVRSPDVGLAGDQRRIATGPEGAPKLSSWPSGSWMWK